VGAELRKMMSWLEPPETEATPAAAARK